MTRSQQQGIIFVALLGVLVVVYARAFRRASHAQPSDPTAEVPPPAPAASSQGAPAALLAPEVPAQREAQRERAAQLAWGRDPFMRGARAGQASGLTLSGVLWDPNQPMAIINGQMVHVGDELEGYRILEITQDRVSVTDGTQTLQLLVAP